jgi:hypothetical protein
MKCKVLIEACSVEELPAMQKKINQWITTGLLRKYQMYPLGDKVIFNICLKKEA